MDRFYLDKDASINQYIDDKDELKHITKVLRMKNGDMFELFDIKGNEYICKITSLSNEGLDFVIEKNVEKSRELNTIVTLYQGIPKQQKMEMIIQKNTELGVVKIVPCKFKRCVSEIKEKEDKKVARWQKIALEAAKQSKRTVITKIEQSLSVKELCLAIKENDLNIVFYELEQQQTLKSLIKNSKAIPKKVGMIVGPEGGFTEEEIDMLQKAGAVSVTLGDRILRTETAGFYGMAVIGYELE